MHTSFDLYGTDLLSELERSRIISLTQRFDPEEYGVSCPSAGVYGRDYALAHTKLSLKAALRVAFRNFGLSFDLWMVEVTCLDQEPVEVAVHGKELYYKFVNWNVRLQPDVKIRGGIRP